MIFDNFQRTLHFVQILFTYVIDPVEYDNNVRFGLKTCFPTVPPCINLSLVNNGSLSLVLTSVHY